MAKAPMDVRRIVLKATDGQIVQGKINLLSEDHPTDRLSDFFVKGTHPFLTVFDARFKGAHPFLTTLSSSSTISGEPMVVVVNKAQIVWIVEDES